MSGNSAKGLRFATVGIIALVALALAAVLSGCGGASDEEQITNAIDAELGIMVDPSDETIADLVEEAGAAEGGSLDQLGIDGTELVKSWIDGFAYEVGDITVDGDTATAEVTITCKQLMVIINDWMDSFQDSVASQGFTTTDEIYAYAGETIMEDMGAAEPVATTVTFSFEKDGSDWTFPDSAENEQALVDAMLGGGSSAADLML